MTAPEPWLILVPLTGAIFAFIFRGGGSVIGLISAIATGILSLLLISLLQPAESARIYDVGGWSPPLGIALYCDGLTAWMIMLTAILNLAVAVYAFGYFKKDATWFWPAWLMLTAAANALFLTRDIFNLYVTLELMSLSSVTLIALANKAEALAAALRYFFVGMLGSLCYLLGVSLLYGVHHTVDMDLLRPAVSSDPGIASLTAAGLMTAGLLLKTALFPLHFWLPPAHANAPAPVSAILSGLVVKVSFYGLLRLWFDVFPGFLTMPLATVFGILGCGAVIWGGVQALVQDRVKLVVAYSTVVQVGYLFLFFPLAMSPASSQLALQGVVYIMLAHAIAKTAAFFAAGNLIKAHGSDRLVDLADSVKSTPATFFALGIAAVSLVGLPPTGGFVGKWNLLAACIESGQWWWILALAIGGILSACYFLRIVRLAFREQLQQKAVLPVTMVWSTMGLALASIALCFMAPILFEWFEAGNPLQIPLKEVAP